MKEAGASEKAKEKTPRSQKKNLKKKYWLNIYREYLFCVEFNASDSFLKTCINCVEQRLKFCHFEGSIIPQDHLQCDLKIPKTSC